jgi:hypothetical protein
MYFPLSYTFQSTLHNYSTINECNEGVIRGSARRFLSGEILLLFLISFKYLSLFYIFINSVVFCDINMGDLIQFKK